MSTKTQSILLNNNSHQNGNHQIIEKPQNGTNKSEKYKKFKFLKEQEDFMQKLKDFHKNRGTPLVNYPTLNGKQIDLLALYNKVCSLGGWEKLCEKEKWDEVAEVFNINANCLNGSHALRNIYIRYLALYEKVNHFGEEPTFTLDDEESRKKFNRTYLFIPKVYNNIQHNYTIANIERILARREYEKLELSLTCGLPNEIDFIFNTILLMSTEQHNFRISNNPRLVALMLAHIGFFADDSYNYRKLYDEWRKHACRNFVKFWHDTVKCDKQEIKNLLPNIYNKCSLELPSQELLGLRQIDGSDNVEAQRIEQVLVILYNFSFDSFNCDYFARTKLLFKFLIMCTYCNYSDIKNEALDILGNISKRIQLNSYDKYDLDNLFYTIDYLIKSDDRYEIIRGLEILTNLCTSEDNEEILIEYLNLEETWVKELFETLYYLLNIQDILILNYSLECFYQMSLFSVTLSNHLLVSTSKSLVSLLTSYLTIDESYFNLDNSPPYKLITQEKPHELINHLKQTPIQSPIVRIERLNIPILNGHFKQQQTVPNEQGKLNMIYWIKTAFSIDLSYRINKMDLYNWYKRTADTNSWNILSLPDFFDHLSKSLMELKIDEQTVVGLKPNITTINTQQIKILPKPQSLQNNQIQTNGPTSINLNINESSNSSSISTLSTSSSLALKDPSKITIPQNNGSCQTTDEDDDEETFKMEKVKEAQRAIDVVLGNSSSQDSNDIDFKVAKIERIINEKSLKRQQNRDEVLNTLLNETSDNYERKKFKKIENEECNNNNNNNNSNKLNDVTNLNQDNKIQSTLDCPQFLCEWDNCKKAFNSIKSLFNHACISHVYELFPYSNSSPVFCLWNKCEHSLKRQKWALINHIQDKHCNPNGIPQRLTQPIYDKNAAIIAIRNHQPRLLPNDFIHNDNGPLSRTIRLLSALILRNLASNSSLVRQQLKQYEDILASNAFNLLEASNAIAQLLWLLNNN